MSSIEYPYMPEGREIKFAAESDPFMQAAARAREECAGDPLYPVGIVLVKDGRVVARAGNGYNRGPGQVHVCPRIVREVPSGTGYELCDLHDSPGHSEPMLMQAAKEQGIDPAGGDVYMYGHWWCCEPCWNTMIEHGIRDVYVLDDAYERFHRDRVYAETLKPKVKTVYLAGAYTNHPDLEEEISFHEGLEEVCNALNLTAIISHRDNPENLKPKEQQDMREIFRWSEGKLIESDVLVAEVSRPSLGCGGELMIAKIHTKPIVLLSKKDSVISDFALGNPAVVYHIEYETHAEACVQLKNVLKQL